jgi:hypothetical protein
MYTHQAQQEKKNFSWKILKPKCDNKRKKRCQILKLENEMKIKIKWITFVTLFTEIHPFITNGYFKHL